MALEESQLAQINHSLHLQTISTITELYKVADPELKTHLHSIVLNLLKPFSPYDIVPK